jgi:hypothetical protein
MVKNGTRTHDHSVERNEDAALGPVGLAICRDIIHEEARADEERYFEQICAFSFSMGIEGRVGGTYRRAMSWACWSTSRGA